MMSANVVLISEQNLVGTWNWLMQQQQQQQHTGWSYTV